MRCDDDYPSIHCAEFCKAFDEFGVEACDRFNNLAYLEAEAHYNMLSGKEQLGKSVSLRTVREFDARRGDGFSGGP